jgi:hypothetical protein
MKKGTCKVHGIIDTIVGLVFKSLVDTLLSRIKLCEGRLVVVLSLIVVLVI